MRYAEADLALSRIPLPPGAFYAQLCFHLQQAAEKSLKAILILHAIDFPHTHNLQRLIELLPSGLPIPGFLPSAAGLTHYAVFARYPATSESISEEEYREALDLAEETVAWAKEYILSKLL